MSISLPPWSGFNTLGQSAAVRSSYFWVAFVPIIAKILSAVPQDYLLPIFGLKVSLVLGVPFTWELLYYSAIFFAFATLVYSIYCPEVVKNYSKYSDFTAQGKGSDQLVAYVYGPTAGKEAAFPFSGIGQRNLLRFLQGYSVKLQNVDPDNADHLDMLNSVPIHPNFHPNMVAVREEKLPGAFWYVRDIYDQHSPAARCVVLILFACGFSLILWILVQNFWYVFSRHLH